MLYDDVCQKCKSWQHYQTYKMQFVKNTKLGKIVKCYEMMFGKNDKLGKIAKRIK